MWQSECMGGEVAGSSPATAPNLRKFRSGGVVQLELLRRIFSLPRLDQEERDRARRMDRKARDPAVDPRVTALAAMSVAAMGAQRADTLDYCREPAQDFAHATP